MFKLQLRVKFNGEKKKSDCRRHNHIILSFFFYIYIYVYIIDNIYISIGRKYGWMVLDRIALIV